MARNTFTQAQVQEMIQQAVAAALQAQVSTTKSSAGKGRKAPSTKSKKVPFTKHDGTVIYGTQKQVDAWTAYANRTYVSPEEREARFADYAKKAKAYKPSKALKDAIKANRAAITRKVAVEQYGFVGTKDDLKALKDSICK